MSATVAITMAGRGQRFRDAGYDVPKYEIEVDGRSLFRWSMDSLDSWVRAGARFVFLTHAGFAAEPFIARECAAAGIAPFDVVELAETTDGQATTALLAGPAVGDPEAPFVVYNIDTHVRPGAMRAQDARGDGWIPCFPGAGDAWSFARAGDDGRVVEVREKQRISPHATVGLYWFGSFALYEGLYARHHATETAGDAAGERYIAPMYNTLIGEGRAVYLHELAADDVVPMGTPAEVERLATAS